jgi:hypothetical protein
MRKVRTGRKGARMDASDAPRRSGVTLSVELSDRVDLSDYSPVTENFPYPEGVISRMAVGASPCPCTTMSRW